MKIYEQMEIQLHVSLMAIDEGQFHILNILTLGKHATVPRKQEAQWALDMVWVSCEIKVPAHIMKPTVSHYTDLAIPKVHIKFLTQYSYIYIINSTSQPMYFSDGVQHYTLIIW